MRPNELMNFPKVFENFFQAFPVNSAANFCRYDNQMKYIAQIQVPNGPDILARVLGCAHNYASVRSKEHGGHTMPAVPVCLYVLPYEYPGGGHG